MALLACGCSPDGRGGYTLANQYRDDVETVAVDLLTRDKKIYRRDLEMHLTEAIIKRIILDTPYKIARKGKADTLLTGTIERISQRVLSYNPDTGDARQTEVTIEISITWQDLRDGKMILKGKRVRAAGTYIPPSPYDQDFFRGSEDAFNGLAKRVVEQMEADW